MKKRISIVVCCYNSREVIAGTLESLARLREDGRFEIQILIVDNNSSDGTTELATEAWEKSGSARPLKTLNEPEQGLSNARLRGFSESDAEFIILCDDDNRLDGEYAVTAFNVMSTDENIAAAGGSGTAVTDAGFPEWFSKYSASFAAGEQREYKGNINDAEGYLWGAGMVLRKQAIDGLISSGFESLLQDRKGHDLTSGGDVELCYALKLAGWKLFYDPALKYEHFIAGKRLTWQNLRRLNRAFGMQKPLLAPYLHALKGNHEMPDSGSEMKMLFGRLRSYGIANWIRFLKLSEGEEIILRMEKTLGRYLKLKEIGSRYAANFEKILNAEWNRRKGGKLND